MNFFFQDMFAGSPSSGLPILNWTPMYLYGWVWLIVVMADVMVEPFSLFSITRSEVLVVGLLMI